MVKVTCPEGLLTVEEVLVVLTVDTSLGVDTTLAVDTSLGVDTTLTVDTSLGVDTTLTTEESSGNGAKLTGMLAICLRSSKTSLMSI